MIVALQITGIPQKNVVLEHRTDAMHPLYTHMAGSYLEEVESTRTRCFIILGDTKKWSDAQDFCDSFRMRLATVSSSNENEFLKSLTNYPNGIWLGGSDSLSEGTWRWNKPTRDMTFYDWGRVLFVPQPNGYIISNCLSYFNCDPLATSYEWVDEPCSVSNPFLCER
ncbi:unnamed protein product [Mytilus edulis]|uniref:C-type lectin domain-containing protein n=1 Tax=Mytilus edulis TaxID=6550 RepID=A0A8S3R5E5_MYTED|nr:unnamed protein product [Mytilus edulis]